MRNTRLVRPESIRSTSDRSNESRARRPLEAIEHAGLVAVGLQAAQPPGADVRQALVVEIHRILGREHDAESDGAALLEQRQQRSFDGGFATGGKNPKISSM